jgi:asparagine synthase (glutamine-hydrolysing)
MAAAMGEALVHRGPDDDGTWSALSPEGPAVTLVHRRLAIQDLSAAGHQPMASACGRWQLIFNGEIYNQHNLRRQLERQGCRFRSSSDTEVLLQLLISDGPAALQRLRGMYAFCLWDQREQRALLARDPYGIKPLYLWHGPDGALVFASEVRALLASGVVPRRLDVTALAGFLAMGSVPEPHTLVAGLQSLPPGWMGTWQRGRWQTQAHWVPSYAPALSDRVPAWIEHTSQALQASTQAHLIGDVPVGLFLSGGLDSSALLALAGGAQLTTVSIGFAQSLFDESARASALAKHFGSRHVALEMDEGRAAQLLPAFLAAVDQPSIDGFNTYCVSHLAAEQGLKVVISGLGGDELFGGYPSFSRVPRLLRLHRRLGPTRPAVARRLGRSHHHQRRRLAAFLQGPASVEAAHACLRGIFAPQELRILLERWGLPLPSLPALPGDAVAEVLQERDRFPSEADRIAWLESTTYMGQQLLRDSDTYSMAHGLELRLPFVDAHLFRELSGIPSSIRLAAGKQLLRDAVPALHGVLPPAPKQGFTFPFAAWFDQPGTPLRPGAAANPLPPLPADLDISPWARRWGLMVLNHWLHQHLGIALA